MVDEENMAGGTGPPSNGDSDAGTKILLVDGNDRIRLLMSQHLTDRGYEVAGAHNGVEAARLMRETLPDLMLIDQEVAMGGMETARLLRQHPRYRRIPIVISTAAGKDEIDRLMEAGKKVHLNSFIEKPCSGPALEKKIAENLRVELDDISLPDLQRELAGLTQLPVLKAAHRKMIDLLGREDDQVDIPEVVRTIEADHGLTTLVLRLCHSAYYGFRGNSIEGATTFLGIARLRQIVQATLVFDAFASEGDAEEQDGFSIAALWKHCVACGLIMEAGGERVKGRDHFIAGMLHDVGKVILHLRFPEHFAEILRLAREERMSMHQAEQELLGITHTDVGHELARKWDLPPTIATCIAFHHQPSRTLQHRRLAFLVHLSDILVRTLNIGHPGDREKIAMDGEAEVLAKYVFAVAERKDEIIRQVESMVGSG